MKKNQTVSKKNLPEKGRESVWGEKITKFLY